MSMTSPNPGPSSETLRTLRSLLPNLKKGLKDGSLRGRGKPGLVTKPRKMCKVCGKLWDHIRVQSGTQTTVQGDFCAECEPKLKAGMIAVVWQDKYAFVESGGKLEDFKGTILHVSEEVWKELEKQFNEKAKSNDGNTDKN